MASAGAAMWMPSTTVPLPRPRTDSASSISVVELSSIEKACASASGNSPAMSGTGASAKPVPRGNCSYRKRRQWNWYGDSMAPAARSRSSGARCARRAASTTALYSVAFLSGLNRMRYSCARIGSAQRPSISSAAQASTWAACAFLRSMASSAACTVSRLAFWNTPLPTRLK